MAGLLKNMTGWLRGSKRSTAAPPRVIIVPPEPRTAVPPAQPVRSPDPVGSAQPEPVQARRALMEPSVASEPSIPTEPRVRSEPFVPELSA